MGEAKRRKAAGTYPDCTEQMPRQDWSSEGAMIVANNSPIPNDIKADISRVVAAVVLRGISGGGDCMPRVVIGRYVPDSA